MRVTLVMEFAVLFSSCSSKTEIPCSVAVWVAVSTAVIKTSLPAETGKSVLVILLADARTIAAEIDVGLAPPAKSKLHIAAGAKVPLQLSRPSGIVTSVVPLNASARFWTLKLPLFLIYRVVVALESM